MKIIKITCNNAISHPTYVVVDEGFKEAEELFLKHYSGCVIKEMELISKDVINAWAQ